MHTAQQPRIKTYIAAVQWMAADSDDFTVTENDFADYEYGDWFRPGDTVVAKALLSDVSGDFHTRTVRGTLIGIGPVMSDDGVDDCDNVVAYIHTGGGSAIWVELSDVLGTPPKRDRKIELDVNLTPGTVQARAVLFAKIAFGKDEVAKQRLLSMYEDSRTWLLARWADPNRGALAVPAAWAFHTLETTADHHRLWSANQRESANTGRTTALWIRRRLSAMNAKLVTSDKFRNIAITTAGQIGARLRPDFKLYTL